MSIEKKQFLNSFKRNAKLLHSSFNVVTNTLISQVKSPTYAQCLEILARALGFKTYKGLTVSEAEGVVYLSDIKESKLYESYIDVNRKNIAKMSNNRDISSDLTSTISAVSTLAYHIHTFPLLHDFYLPKVYLSKQIDFDRGPFQINDMLSKICVHWCLSLLIEKPHGYEFYKGIYENNTDIIYDIPMSFFSPKKISDWNRSRDFLHDFTDLFQHCDFIRVQTGWTDFDNFHNSKMNIFIPPALHERITKLAQQFKAGAAK